MELKRYVLLNGYNLILDSKNEEELRVVHYDDGDVLKVVVDNWYYPLEKLDYKTSGNIFDLVEVGDLVGINNMSGIFYIDDIITDEDCLRVFICDQKYSYWFEFNETEVKAIYKRQTNGDYKRYEVKE